MFARRLVAVTVVACAVLLCAPVAADAEDGAQRRRAFISAYSLEDGSKRWSVTVGERPGAITLVAASRRQVFAELGDCFGGEVGNRQMIAFDASNGREQWRTKIYEPVTYDPLHLSGDVGPATSTIVVRGAHDQLRGLDPVSGEERWRLQLADRVPLGGTESLLLLATRSADYGEAPRAQAVEAIDRRTGTTSWRSTLPEGFNLYSATFAPGTVVAALRRQPGPVDFRLLDPIAFDAADGTKRWGVSTTLGSFPAAAGDVVAWFSAAGGLEARETTTGTPAWTNPALPVGRLTAWGGQLYSSQPEETASTLVTAVEADTGAVTWQARTGVWDFSFAGGALIGLNRQPGQDVPSLEAIDSKDGSIRWQRNVPPGSLHSLAKGAAFVAGGCEAPDI